MLLGLWHTQRESAASCRKEGQLTEGQEGQKHKAPRSTGPPPQSRPFRVYLTLRVLSSLDQESVEGKEGRDEEEVTSALLPIWKGKKETLGKIQTTKTLPTTYPGFSPGFPVRVLKSYSPRKISAKISDRGLTAMLADDRCSDMFMLNPLMKWLPEITQNL